MNPVVAGAVRKWKSAVTISKARTYRAVFCTARDLDSYGMVQFQQVLPLDRSHLPPRGRLIKVQRLVPSLRDLFQPFTPTPHLRAGLLHAVPAGLESGDSERVSSHNSRGL